jgi:hypothetical protein
VNPYNATLNKKKSFFAGKNVIAAVEFTNDKLIVVIDEEQYIYKLCGSVSGNLVKNTSSRQPQYCGV